MILSSGYDLLKLLLLGIVKVAIPYKTLTGMGTLTS
jgi:hypothetical protein